MTPDVQSAVETITERIAAVLKSLPAERMVIIPVIVIVSHNRLMVEKET